MVVPRVSFFAFVYPFIHTFVFSVPRDFVCASCHSDEEYTLIYTRRAPSASSSSSATSTTSSAAAGDAGGSAATASAPLVAAAQTAAAAVAAASETVCLAVVRGPDALRAFLTQQLPAFQSAAGVLHFVYSVLLTRGLDHIRAGTFFLLFFVRCLVVCGLMASSFC